VISVAKNRIGLGGAEFEFNGGGRCVQLMSRCRGERKRLLSAGTAGTKK
jgi:hypothetical protein